MTSTVPIISRHHPLLSTLCICFMGMLCLAPPARAGAKPPPLKGTQADFYVSWDHGDNAFPGTIDKPFKTPDRAVSLLKAMPDPSGKIVLIRGGDYRLRDSTENRLMLKDLHGSPGAPIQIRGYPGEEVLLDAFEDEFDPMNPTYMPTGWGGICFTDSSHILVENFKVTGRAQCNIELTNSDHITIRYIEAFRSNKHGLFTGGSFHDLTIECCKFYEQIYGSSCSHGIYISGGHWDPTLPPVRNISIRWTESYYNGRHGLQFNGRIENMLVEHCNFHHNILGGISVIGGRNGVFRENVIYKNNKQGVILYTYFDTAYWDPNDPSSVQHWKDTHWTCENILIQNNTIFMDDVAWYNDEWVNYNPTYHAAVYIVDTSELLPPFKNIWIMNNIFHNHSKTVVTLKNPEFFQAVRGINNLFLSEGHVEAMGADQLYAVKDLEKSHPTLWKGNMVHLDPRYLKITPTKVVDRTYKEVDFSKKKYASFSDDFHLQPDSPAWSIGAGAHLTPYAMANTHINTDSEQGMPEGYGLKIAQAVLYSGLKLEIKQWFLNNFHPGLQCLKARTSPDANERICFRNPAEDVISFAILNEDAGPIEMETRLTCPGGRMTYCNVLGVAFDKNMEITLIEDMEFENDTIRCILGEQSVGIFLVQYMEK